MLDHTIDYKNIQPVSDEHLALINSLLANVNIAIPSAMAYIRKIQGWKFHQLEKRLQGLSNAALRGYFQLSYQKMRPLHAVAAYSWLTMMPMACFYRGPVITAAYPDMDDLSVKCLIHSGLLPADQFKVMTSHLYNYLSVEQQKKAKKTISGIESTHGKLKEYKDSDFLFPKNIDFKMFAYDYYYSLAVGCRKIREENNISQEVMAKVVNLSLYRYQRLEESEKPIPLPVELGARLQLGLGLENAMHFTAHMKTYPQFHTARRIQYIRQATLGAMLKYLESDNKKYFSDMVLNLSSMYLNPPE